MIKLAPLLHVASSVSSVTFVENVFEQRINGIPLFNLRMFKIYIDSYVHIYEIIRLDLINYIRFIFNNFYNQGLFNIDSNFDLSGKHYLLFMSLN